MSEDRQVRLVDIASDFFVQMADTKYLVSLVFFCRQDGFPKVCFTIEINRRQQELPSHRDSCWKIWGLELWLQHEFQYVDEMEKLICFVKVDKMPAPSAWYLLFGTPIIYPESGNDGSKADQNLSLAKALLVSFVGGTFLLDRVGGFALYADADGKVCGKS